MPVYWPDAMRKTRTMKRLRQHTRGVTLLEMLVVVAIIGILSLISLPNIPYIIMSQRIRTSNNDIVAKLRSLRQLSISKGRKLRVEVNAEKQWFKVWKEQYTEYNPIDENDEEKDLTTVLSEDPTDLNTQLQKFELFSESEELLHVIPRWNNDGTPIYEVPINYALQDGMANGYNGIETMTFVDAASKTAATELIMYPTGNFDRSYIITIRNNRYDREYTIRLYRSGQIRSTSVQ